MKESEILRLCLDYLRINNIFCFRANSAAFFSQDGKRFIRTHDIKGVSDIIGVLPASGKFLAVECKTAKGRQSIEQKAFQMAVERNNGIYIIARSTDDLKDILNDAK